MSGYLNQQEYDAIILCLSQMQEMREGGRSIAERRGAQVILPREMHLKLIDKLGSLYSGGSYGVITKDNARILVKGMKGGLLSLQGEEQNRYNEIFESLKNFSERK